MIANSLIIYIILSSLILFTLFNLVLKIVYKSEKAINFFLYFCICYFIGLALTTLRNEISDFLSIVIGVTILVLGYIFLYIGARALLGLSCKWRNRYLIPIFLVLFGFYIFSYIYYDLQMRIIIFSLFSISYSIALSYIFWIDSLKKLKTINTIASIYFIIVSIVFLLRALNASTMAYAIEFLYSTKFMVLSPYIALFCTLFIFMFIISAHLRYKRQD